MPTSTVEDYIKAIYSLQHRPGAEEASVVGIAEALGVTKGSVTSMVRRLDENGLVKAPRYAGVRLTKKGQRLALETIRRHRLIELFLVEVLGFDWSEVHEEAERLEHAISDKLLDSIDAYLGRPTNDPHGSPIPDAEGRVEHPTLTPLNKLDAGAKGRIARLDDQNSALLELAARDGLRPGTRITIAEIDEETGTIHVKPFRQDAVAIKPKEARGVLVEIDAESGE